MPLFPTTSTQLSQPATKHSLSSADLEVLSAQFRKAQARLEAAEVLSRNAEDLSCEMARHIAQLYPESVSNSKFLFTSVPEVKSHSFKDDIDVLLRLISYFLVAGNDYSSESAPMSEMLKEISQAAQNASSISTDWYSESLQFLRKNHGLSGERAKEANDCIDQILAIFS